MSYFFKHIDKVEFYGIKYRKIQTVNDYTLLKKEVDELVTKADKAQILIGAENLKNQALEEKDSSMTINFSLINSFIFGIISLVMGAVFGKEEEILSILSMYIICIGINVFAIWLLVNRANDILKLRNAKVVFYETICKIIRGKE